MYAISETLEYFERVKEISTKKDLPPFVYNQLVYCYRLHGKWPFDVMKEYFFFYTRERRDRVGLAWIWE